VVDHPDGKVFFVEGVFPGEEGEFLPLKEEKNYGFARLVKLLKPSTKRIEPFCSLHGFAKGCCHGCPWMELTYVEQVAQKQALLEQQLSRAGLFEVNTEQLPFVAAPEPRAYRNRAQFKTDGIKLGFVSDAGEKEIVDIPSCPILTEKMQQQLVNLRQKLPYSAWKPPKGMSWNFIDVEEEGSFPLNERAPFRQGNSAQNLVMQEWVKGQLLNRETPCEVLELFCGAGNFTEVLVCSAAVERVVALEASKEAIETLKSKKFNKCKAYALDLFDDAFLHKMKRWVDGPKLLLLDPPRAGFKGIGPCVDGLPTLEQILYISCDLATFISDALQLKKRGWLLKSIQGVDLFPQTPHIEVLAVFSGYIND
jgi:23S rRNA (uracil1939-C5)-methyltransferase